MQTFSQETVTRQLLLRAATVLSVFVGTCAQAGEDADFSMRIMDAFSITGRGVVLTGQIESGTVVVGGAACVPLNSGETAARRVEGIEQFRKVLDSATAGDNVAILVTGVDEDDVAKGKSLNGDCTPEAEAEAETE